MAAGLLGGLGSERRLARSVAHRLKYYIEVQRKENSFQLSGPSWDESENFCLHPVYLTEQRAKEHNFAKIKLEAFLRAYIGNAEECNRKVQGNLVRQKEVEKLIKKMARDYIPDRINDVKMKSRTRQNKIPCSLSKLYLNAVPPLSPEEVKRLVSSASKLIVAATSKISPEEMETTQELKRREKKSVTSFSDGHKENFSTILFHENQARRGQQSQTRQSDKEIKRKTKVSNASSTTPAKSRIFSMAAWNTQQKTFVPSLKGTVNVGMHSCTPFKIRRQESSSKAGEDASGKNCPPRKPRAAGPSQTLGSKAHKDRPQRSVVLKSKEQKVSKGSCAPPSARSTAEIYSSQHSTTGRKIRKQFSSETMSRSSILKRVSDPKPQPNDPREKLVTRTQRNGTKGEQESSDSLSRTTSKRHQVNFANWESFGLEKDRERGSQDDGDNTTAPSTEKCGLAEGHNGDCACTVQQGPPFLHELCQEMTQEAPADQTRGESNQSFSPKEPRDARGEEDRVDSSPSPERVLESESCKGEAICIPPTAPAGCRCSELPSYCMCEIKEEQETGFPGETAPLSNSLDGEESDEELTNSSLSSSARSSSWLCEQMDEDITLKEAVNPKMGTFLQKLLKAPENGTIPQEVSNQYEKQK
ncbi:uncharacterized protein LOC113438728 [Pseudonaja textilis]|uniref:uncharacterized protein LOC113438728 n=1 Tax=Pseudonaja textilis TaxID=8673 RepID=UPI000EA88957|nr:uncharacterized protein LOC113438728 [Pseudonaja textilis]